MKTYSICLIELENRKVVVIGGGQVAARKTAGLVEAGAIPQVISPNFAPELLALAVAGQAELVARPYAPGDLDSAFLIIAATDDPLVNQAVWQEAEAQGCLVNVVDDPAHSNFIVPAVVRRGELNIAITTGGSSPALARRLRERLEAEFPPDYAGYVDLLAQLRPELIARTAPGVSRLEAALRLVDSDLFDVLEREGRPAAHLYALSLLDDCRTLSSMD